MFVYLLTFVFTFVLFIFVLYICFFQLYVLLL